MATALSRWAEAALDLVAPRVCLACDAERQAAHGLCAMCRHLVRPQPRDPCPRCAAALGPGVDVSACIACADMRPRFAAAVAAAVYPGLAGPIVNSSALFGAAHSTAIQLSNGTGANQGNNIVYFIDGNMWINSAPVTSYKITTANGSAVRVTFVVKGNIYISDNLIRQIDATDGVSLIALKDATVPDSGNIYFGDAVYGTLERMDAFMYAENNFLDTNLNAGGSSHLTVNGTMSAGNQIRVQRDYGGSHTRLDLNFDNRIANDALVLPGMPPLLGGNNQHDWRLASMIAIGL